MNAGWVIALLVLAATIIGSSPYLLYLRLWLCSMAASATPSTTIRSTSPLASGGIVNAQQAQRFNTSFVAPAFQ
jgi:hypothetical protein